MATNLDGGTPIAVRRHRDSIPRATTVTAPAAKVGKRGSARWGATGVLNRRSHLRVVRVWVRAPAATTRARLLQIDRLASKAADAASRTAGDLGGADQP